MSTYNCHLVSAARALLPDLIDESAERAPEALAVEAPDGALTYRELVLRSNRLARELRARGVGPEECVAVRIERSVHLPVAMLGVLKAGCAYIPLDPDMPAERSAYIVSHAAVRVVLTGADLEVLRVDPSIDESPPASAISPTQLAYVMYTSGSTGRPKGVHVQHGSLVNFLQSMQDAPGFTNRDVLVAVTTISFDISGLELFLPLISGGRVVIASRDAARDMNLLPTLLERSGATVLQATPSTWRMLVEAGWKGARRLTALCGGEALPPDLARELAGRVKALWNLYGPTETTIWSSRKQLAPTDTVTLGEPIANTQLHVLDPETLEPVEAGTPGELFIGGDGLARGYGGQPDLTAQRFVPDPFAGVPGARMYRTGDRARRNDDGELEYLGRVDHQIKLRGFRIELGEIEAVLAEHPGVREVVVALHNGLGEPRLVAYVVANDVVAEALLISARARIPEYMVPATVVFLDSLPLNANGKVDRNALPEPPAQEEHGRRLPTLTTERLIAQLWSEVLGTAAISLDDNFFRIGGHSLLAMRVAAKVAAAFEVDFPMSALFAAPTVSAVCEWLYGEIGREQALEEAEILLDLE